MVPNSWVQSIASPFRIPTNQHSSKGLVLFSSCTTAPRGLPWLHGYGKDAKNVINKEEASHRSKNSILWIMYPTDAHPNDATEMT